MEQVTAPPIPVVVFAYKRLEHLRRTIESLRANALSSDTDVVIYCDGAKARADLAGVAAVRGYADSIVGFASTTVRARSDNLGLAKSIVNGVTEMLSKYSAVIVLEDDLLLSQHFLAYMNEAIALYENDARVASIHAYCFPVREQVPETFFLRGADCWGWATWRSAWLRYRPDSQSLLSELEERRLTREFDLDDSYPFTQMLRDQIAGRNDSWAIRWHASCFLADALTLYPGRSLVHNIGNDASGTHAAATDLYSLDVADTPIQVERIDVTPSEAARVAFVAFYRQLKRKRWLHVFRWRPWWRRMSQ